MNFSQPSFFKLSEFKSPTDFLKYIKSPANRAAIKSVRFVPPQPGSEGFGKVHITYKYGAKLARVRRHF